MLARIKLTVAGDQIIADGSGLTLVSDDGNGNYSVPVLNDSLPEANETVLLTLQNPRGGATIDPPGTATLTIPASALRPGMNVIIALIIPQITDPFYPEVLLGVESIAREHGCTFAHTCTFTYQAPDFYQHLGYRVFAVLDDYPEGIKEYFLKKKLGD